MSAGEEQLALQIRAMQLPPPEREYRFHPERRWRFDYAWPPHKLALEIEGGHWAGGRHVRGSGFEKDCEKYSEAAIAGWRLLRVTTAMVKDGRAIDALMRALGAGK